MYNIWKPPLPESIDGQPLSQSVSELFADFPYDRLPADSPLVAWIMKPETVAILIVAYWISKPVLKFVVSVSGFDGNQSSIFRALVAVHNFGLCIFSGAVVIYSWPIVYLSFSQNGSFQTYCDPEHSFWNESGFGVWALIFYISKYYEFVDTWILILKVRS